MGLILFGWPEKTDVVGEVADGYCAHCQNKSVWYLIKTRRWIRILSFWLFPFGRKRWWLACDICGASFRLNRQEVDTANILILQRMQYHKGILPKDEYETGVEEFNKQVSSGAETSDELKPPIRQDDSQIRFIQ